MMKIHFNRTPPSHKLLPPKMHKQKRDSTFAAISGNEASPCTMNLEAHCTHHINAAKHAARPVDHACIPPYCAARIGNLLNSRKWAHTILGQRASQSQAVNAGLISRVDAKTTAGAAVCTMHDQNAGS
jgi:hypothetical protein